MRSRLRYEASFPTRNSNTAPMILNTRRPRRTGTPRGRITVRTADISVARTMKTPAIPARTRSAITRSSSHQLARGLLDAAAEGGVDRKRLRELLNGQVRVHGERERKDEVGRVWRDDGTADDDVAG